MKICLSRKGFDSQYGGMPSPILPDGRLVPLPIPSSHDDQRMKDVYAPGVPLADLLQDLSRGRWSLLSTVHLDPILSVDPFCKPDAWRPALGQTGSAQSHLNKQEFGSGDVFLFFGWFRAVELSTGRWRYVRGAPDLHVIFGWLEVDEVLPIVEDRESALRRHPWIKSHPHVASPEQYTDPRNTLYIASAVSRFGTNWPFGAGLFPRYLDSLRLTQPEASGRSTWGLPAWFMPSPQRPALTYHSSPARWAQISGGVTLKSVAKGQEFVLDADYYPEAIDWVEGLIRGAAQ